MKLIFIYGAPAVGKLTVANEIASRYFIYSDLKGIFLCDSETKKTTEILKPSAYEIQGANISADDKTLYFRYLQVDADVWLIDASQQNQ